VPDSGQKQRSRAVRHSLTYDRQRGQTEGDNEEQQAGQASKNRHSSCAVVRFFQYTLKHVPPHRKTGGDLQSAANARLTRRFALPE